MRNLLWKFAALAGVTGIGFLVVLQALDSLSVEPKLGPQQAQAGSKPAQEPASQSAQTQALLPLETQEMVALADPSPPRTGPSRRAASPPVPSGNPFPSASSATSPANSPASRTADNSVAQVAFPLEFPARPSVEELPPPEPEPADLPDLPVLIPASNQTEAPDLEAFSQGQEPPKANPFPAPNLGNPATEAKPKPQDDPFADPPALTESKPSKTEPPTVPFDPYEPLPPGEAKNAAPAVPTLAEESKENAADPLDLNPPLTGPSFGEVPKTAPTPGRASVQIGSDCAAGNSPGSPGPRTSPGFPRSENRGSESPVLDASAGRGACQSGQGDSRFDCPTE